MIGAEYDLYQSTGVTDSLSAAVSHFNDAVFVRKQVLTIPYYNANVSMPSGNLFSGVTMDETVYEALNAFSPDWKDCTVLMHKYLDYDGAVPYESVRSLFPHAINVPISNTWYFTRDDIDGVYCICGSNVFCFKKSDGTEIVQLIWLPFIEFRNVAYNVKTVRSMLPFYNVNNENAVKRLSSTGYAATSQDGKWWLGNAFDSSISQSLFYSVMEDNYEYPEDPYYPGGYSGGDLTEGDFDFEGDPQPLGPVPSWVKTGLDTGFYTLYNPSAGELRSLASYLWSNNFDLDMLKKLFNNPMDLILNFGVVPCPIQSGGQKEVGIGLISTGIMMNTAAERHVYLSMGDRFISPAYRAYLDWSPYTRCDLILPFVGVIPVDIDAIMGRSLQIVYNIDILTGACVAGLNVLDAGNTNWAKAHSIGEYAGNCMMPLPLTGSDYSNMISGLIQTAGTIAAGVATGGGAGAVAGGLSAASSAIVNEGKPLIQKGGAISSAAGYLGHLKPTLIFSIPKQCLPSTQIAEEGFPAFVSGLIGDITGFAKVYEVHLDNIPATDEELEEIEAILKGGFFA